MPASTWTPPAATSSALIVQQQAVIGRLERRIAQLEDNAKPGAHRGCPASSPGPARNLRPPSSPGSPGPMAFRRRMAPTHRVGAVESCPDCGTPLSGLGTRRSAPGPRASGPGLSPLPAQPELPWGRAPGGNLVSLIATRGRRGGCPSASNGICAPSTSCASAWAPSSPPSIAWRNRPGLRCRASWSASAAAPWSTR